MAHEYKNICIAGCGASGCVCAYFLLKAGFEVTVFEKDTPLKTLLPTGGGRCNLAYAEYDFKSLAKNYPRGEKFLYSIFSRFSTIRTLELFKELGIETYSQDDSRIFPVCNSAKIVRKKILEKIRHARFIKEKVNSILPCENGFKIKTDKAEYLFTDVVVSTGGHAGYDLIQNLGIKITAPRASLVGLKTAENFQEFNGTAVKNVSSCGLKGDILFTRFGISGPLIYKISSLKAFEDFPYRLTLDLCPDLPPFQDILNSNPHKEIKNILSKFLPQKIAKFILSGMDETTKGCNINGKTRDLIIDKVHRFKAEITGTNPGEETVTAGGVDLDEINSKTMESKKVPRLYFSGEVLNIDGFCGGFNLQNAWSTAYVAAEGIISQAE